MGLQITPALRDSLARLYFMEDCDQNGRAYVPLQMPRQKQKQDLTASLSGAVVAFLKGAHTVNVRMPALARQEIEKASLSFDYLACNVDNKSRYDDPVVASPLGLCWVKLGGAKKFSEAQLEALERVSLPVAVFSIRDVLAPPGRIETRWDQRAGKEWLDMLDDQRDQAESDDDFL